MCGAGGVVWYKGPWSLSLWVRLPPLPPFLVSLRQVCRPHPCPLYSYEGVLASYLPPTVEPLPFSCFGEEQPGVGPLYGEELLLVEVGLWGRDSERGRGVSDGVVRGSRSRSGLRSAAEGGNGKASGNPVM